MPLFFWEKVFILWKSSDQSYERYKTRLFVCVSGSEGGMSEAPDQSLRPGAAESSAERFVPAEDQARLRPASPGKTSSSWPVTFHCSLRKIHFNKTIFLD